MYATCLVGRTFAGIVSPSWNALPTYMGLPSESLPANKAPGGIGAWELDGNHCAGNYKWEHFL